MHFSSTRSINPNSRRFVFCDDDDDEGGNKCNEGTQFRRTFNEHEDDDISSVVNKTNDKETRRDRFFPIFVKKDSDSSHQRHLRTR